MNTVRNQNAATPTEQTIHHIGNNGNQTKTTTPDINAHQHRNNHFAQLLPSLHLVRYRCSISVVGLFFFKLTWHN